MIEDIYVDEEKQGQLYARTQPRNSFKLFMYYYVFRFTSLEEEKEAMYQQHICKTLKRNTKMTSQLIVK